MYSRTTLIKSITLIFVLFFSTFVFTAEPAASAQTQSLARLHQFDLLTASSGWVLLDGHLFWTEDAGDTWSEIGPAGPSRASIQDVEFLDSKTGWMLWSTTASDGSSLFDLAHTTDGIAWTNTSLSLFEPGEIASFAERAQMSWLDAQTGWISVKQVSGSNFSVGTLFITSDGGDTWSRSALPVADEVHFDSQQTGWAVGGPAGDQIFRTKDAGATWQTLEPDDIPEDTDATAYPPFVSDGQSLLVMTHLGAENNLAVYSLNDSSDQWLPVDSVSLDVEPGVIGLSILDPQNFVAAIPGTGSIVRMAEGELQVLESPDSTSIIELDMVSPETGWGRAVDSGCVANSADSVSCSSATRLLRTLDGGASWQSLALPSVKSEASPPETFTASRATIMNSLAEPGNTQVLIGQGFDKCEVPSLAQLQGWSGNSPYMSVNLYIGGSSRACDNLALSTAFVRQAYQQGWKFIPTWVGPQAPCTGYLSRMSSDPATAYNQGVVEADLAVERLAALGLTYPDKTGSVVYYDIEAYGTNSSCRTAVNSFMNGWVSQIHARGNLAGVYGSTLCNTGLSDFMSIPNVPDVIWPARWYHSLGSGYYDPTATVWNLGSCLPNNAWSNHQRIRQYEGDHNESWGNVPLRIDSNVLDGVVAIPYGFYVSSIARADASPTSAASVKFAVSFFEPVTGVDVTDFALAPSGVTGASITNVSGSGSAYTVTVNTGSGNGTIRLDLVDNDSIRNAANAPLGGAGAGNGSYGQGKPYRMIKTPSFRDAPISHWAWQYIERLYAAGTTGGCTTNPPNYCPDDVVTRAQMAVFLERGIRGPSYTPPSVGNSTGFADVPTNYWAAAWIKQLAADGITAGCGDGIYCPDAPITRAEMAVFLLRSRYGFAYSPPSVGGSTGFGDVSPNYWSAAWIKQLAAEGITGGCANGNYCPELPVTRAQMAVFLVNTFRLP